MAWLAELNNFSSLSLFVSLISLLIAFFSEWTHTNLQCMNELASWPRCYIFMYIYWTIEKWCYVVCLFFWLFKHQRIFQFLKFLFWSFFGNNVHETGKFDGYLYNSEKLVHIIKSELLPIIGQSKCKHVKAQCMTVT